MENTFPQLPPLYRDSEGLRTNMIAQRNKYTAAQTSAALSETPQNFHANLKKWAQLPVKAVLLPQATSAPAQEIPAAPVLSYTQAGVRGDNSLVSDNWKRHEEARCAVVEELIQYSDRLISAVYQDLSQFRDNLQYKLGDFEQQYNQVILDESNSPQQLISRLFELETRGNDYIRQILDQIAKCRTELTASVQTAVAQAIEGLQQNCCTADDIKDYIARPVDDYHLKTDILFERLNDFARAADARFAMTSADFTARAFRVMGNRRKSAAEQLIREFRSFVIVQNEWSEPFTESVIIFNCQFQQMAAHFHDQLNIVQNTNRRQLFAIFNAFTTGRQQNSAAFEQIAQTFQNGSRAVQNARDQTIERLQQIQMPGSGYCREIVAGWEQRWEKRIARLQEASERQTSANAFYLCGIIIVFKMVEDIKIQACDNERKLQKYFDDAIEAIESRFQRDINRYQAGIQQLEQQYQNIWNPGDAQVMSQIAAQLIDAMEKATKRRQESLIQLVADEDSVFTQVILDKLLEELQIYRHIMVGQELEIAEHQNSGSVQWNNGDMVVERFDTLISERKADIRAVSAEAKGPEPPRSAGKSAKSVSPSKSAHQPKREAAKPAKGKQPVYQLNENGLYMDLPNFADISQEEYLKTHGFSFSNDNFSEQAIREQIQAVVGVQNDKKKEVKKAKGEVMPTALQDVQLELQPLQLSTKDAKLHFSMKTLSDYRVIIYLAILHYMQEEGKRVAFNRSRLDFIAQIEQWKAKYLQILNDVAKQAYDEQADQQAKAKAAIDKKNKAKKKDAPDEAYPAEPEPFQPLARLPQDVEARLQDVFIPAEKPRDESDVFMTLIYRLLDYDALKQIPSQSAVYSLEVADVMFQDTDGVDPTPNVSGPPTRPGTGKSKPSSPQTSQPAAQKRAEKASKAPQAQAAKQQIELPLPEHITQFFSDSRLVTHGQAAVLQIVFDQILKTELQSVLDAASGQISFYQREGASLRQRCSMDTYRLQLQQQSDRMHYVQQKTREIQLQFAQRNGLSKRLIEKGQALISDVSLKYLQTDTRFSGLYDASRSAFQLPEQDAATPKLEASPGRAKSAKKAAGAVDAKQAGTRQLIEQTLVQKQVEDYVEVVFDQEKSCISAVLFKDAFGRNIPLLRACADEFKAVVICELARQVSERPEGLHKVVLHQKQAFIAAACRKIQQKLYPEIFSRLEAYRGELQLKIEEIATWGSQSDVPPDFCFADRTVAFMDSNYGAPRRLAEGLERSGTVHPTFTVCLCILEQLNMASEDVQSEFAQDLHLIGKALDGLAAAVAAGNGAQIQAADRRTLVCRQASKLRAAITGRLGSVERALGQAEEDLGQTKAFLDQFSSPKDCATEGLETNFLGHIASFVGSWLLVEHCAYLLAYDRDLNDIIQGLQTPYVSAFETYSQRQRALNCALGLLLLHAAAVHSYFGDAKGDCDAEAVQRLFSASERLVASKTFVQGKQAYTDNSAVDILTHFAACFKDIAQAAGSGGQQAGAGNSQGLKTGTAADYVAEMTDDLNQQLAAARKLCLRLSDVAIALFSNLLRSWWPAFFRRFVLESQQHSVQDVNGRLEAQQDALLKRFDQLYQAVRPGLAKYPEKQRQLLDNAQTLHADWAREIDSAETGERLSAQFAYLQFSALIGTVLLSFAPFAPGSLQSTAQLSVYLDQFAAAAHEQRSKTPAEEPCACILGDALMPKQAKQATAFAAGFQKVARIASQAFAARKTLFSYLQIDQKALAASKTILLFEKAPIVSAVSGNAVRQFLPGAPKSEKTDRKAPAVERTLPGVTIPTALAALTLCEKPTFLEQAVQVLVSDDAESLKYAAEAANLTFALCDENRKDFAELQQRIAEKRALNQKVHAEFAASIAAVSQ